MRHLTILLFVFSFISLNAQDCPPGSVSIGSQAEASAFITQYPNCTRINGSLYFDTSWGASVDVTTGFANIKSITGDLGVVSCPVTGTFAQLDSIMGGISAYAPDYEGQGIVGVDFPNLKYIGGDMYVSDGNEYSAHISASFPALERIEGDLSACGSLGSSVSCNDCVNLSYIGGDVRTWVEGLNSVDTIMGTIDFESCAFGWHVENYNLSGYNELKYIGGDLILGGYKEFISDFSGFQQLNTINGRFFYWRDDYCYPSSLYSIAGLGQLRYVNGNFGISGTCITNLDFLSNLETVGGYLTIINNSLLNDVSGLDHAIDIGETLTIRYSDLSDCAVQAVCDHIDSNGDTEISDNLEGCSSVEEVEAFCNACTSDFVFTTQQEVDDFPVNYPGCINIEGNLIINGITPTEINNLDSLSRILSISDTIFIIDNQALTDISGLKNINYIRLNHVQISGNSMLADCSIKSICRLIGDASGTTSIYDNSENCNSETEVLDNCPVCPDAPVFLYSQAEVDSFPILYPNCSSPLYSIKIDGDNINNLDSLIQIKDMEDCLTIEYCSTLTNLSGLDNLESAGCLTLRNNGLIDISALSNLTNVQGELRLMSDSVDLVGLENLQHVESLLIYNNDAVTDLTSLSSLNSLSDISVSRNDNLVSLDGLQNFTEIRELSISNNDALISLDGLNNIIRVDEIDIVGNSSLLSLEGLNSLTEVSVLFITRSINDSSPGLQNLSGLDNLTTINEYLWIRYCEHLNNFEGLNSLTSIGGSFTIEDNSALDNFSGLENLATIGGDLRIYSNDALINLEGLNNLETINGNLRIGSGNHSGVHGNAVADISALSSLTSINGELHIADNNNLTTINNSLENLDYNTVTHLFIARNNSLSMCNSQIICDYLNAGGSSSFYWNDSGCNSQAEIQVTCDCSNGDLTFTTQQQIDDFGNTSGCVTIPGNLAIQAATPGDITNLDGLSQITTIDGWLLIEGTSASDLNGLSNLTSVGNALVVKNNPSLTDVSGLGNMSTLPSSLSIDNNDALIDLSGLENISQIGEGLLIFDNAALQNLSGLEGLNSIGSQLYVQYNAALTNFSGLENLTSIGTNIRLQNNASLNTLTALSNVNMLGGYIRISGHNVLTSLGGLENINPNSITDLILTNNPNLVVCNQVSVCTYLENGGTANITNNASGCNTQAEIEAICNDPCLATPLMNVNHQSIPDGLYQAVEEVNSTGTVPNNGTVNFKAGEVILLDNGFSITPNADFSAEIEDCDGN